MARGYKKVTELTPEQQLNKRMDDVQHMVSEYSKGLARVMELINSKADHDAIKEYVDEIEINCATDARVDKLSFRVAELEKAIAPAPLQVAAKRSLAEVYHDVSITLMREMILKGRRKDKRLLLL